ncbi:hypothetical protein [Mycoplasmopsis alligatoris]|uniref:Uncharacterized protein n=1 Tax=Mycoplasmopsis alligatoris A21JP2 TaxID=747682 RepID=D4XX13_9BACT|nr:hypothetical protein [Mycoplasmopsis alligatoris]EFF41270.1 hypothetical protein MALL_0250 [Mycoplasmopsis alligatoris A21JP2]
MDIARVKEILSFQEFQDLNKEKCLELINESMKDAFVEYNKRLKNIKISLGVGAGAGFIGLLLGLISLAKIGTLWPMILVGVVLIGIAYFVIKVALDRRYTALNAMRKWHNEEVIYKELFTLTNLFEFIKYTNTGLTQKKKKLCVLLVIMLEI